MLENQRDKESIILNIFNYLLKGYKLKPAICEKVEVEMIKEGLIQKGGYMDVRDYFREEGREEGRTGRMAEGATRRTAAACSKYAEREV